MVFIMKIKLALSVTAFILFSQLFAETSDSNQPSIVEQKLIELCNSTQDPVRKQQVCDELEQYRKTVKAAYPNTTT